MTMTSGGNVGGVYDDDSSDDNDSGSRGNSH